MPAAMPCKIPIKSSGETHRNIGKRMTKHACVRCRRIHETKAWRSWTQTSSRSHYCERDEFLYSSKSWSQIHSDTSRIQNSRCKGGSGEGNVQNWRKFRHGQQTKVRNKKEVIDEARNNGRKVHFASLMDLCHLKNSELEPNSQKYTGRVVLRRDIVKYDSGSHAVFTEQGSSASQMTGRFFSKTGDTDMNGPVMRESEMLVLGELPC